MNGNGRKNTTGRLKKKSKSDVWEAPDGTHVSIADMDYLLECNKTKASEWLEGYRKWKRTQVQDKP